jgi:catalase
VKAKDMAPSPALSIMAKATPTLEGRKVGCLVTDGVDGGQIARLKAAVTEAGANLELIGARIGGVKTASGKLVPVDHRIDGGPSILFDAVALLPSEEGGEKLAMEAAAVNFLRDAYGHLKVIGYLPTAAPLFAKGGLADAEAGADAGLVSLEDGDFDAFVARAAEGRIWDREPKVREVV